MKRFIVIPFFLLAVAAGAASYIAGRGTPPVITIVQPASMIGAASSLEATVVAPPGTLVVLDAAIEQDGQRLPLFSLAQPGGATLTQDSPEQTRVVRAFSRRDLPQLKPGTARVVVYASRSTLFGYRTIDATAGQDVEVRFDPPRLAVLSVHHFVNHAGSEMVAYRVTPPDVASWVRVGDLTYAGYPAAGAGVSGADPSIKVAFFALTSEQDLNTRIDVVARDTAGNEARTPLDAKVLARPFRRSRIQVDDRFIGRVVPAILDRSSEFKATLSSEEVADPVKSFLKVNGDLRRRNAEQIASYAAKTSPERLWDGAFQPLPNAQVESGFGDRRTYMHDGREIDRQVHLGFDLAVTAAIPIQAGNRGRVVHADWLGIYGNTVIVDHGMGVQSLYAHLSSIDVKPGDEVQKNQVIGRSGATGLAGGDHLHFTMLVHGQPVNPVDWWDPHWIEDRITRKLRELQPAAAKPAGS